MNGIPEYMQDSMSAARGLLKNWPDWDSRFSAPPMPDLPVTSQWRRTAPDSRTIGRMDQSRAPINCRICTALISNPMRKQKVCSKSACKKQLARMAAGRAK